MTPAETGTLAAKTKTRLKDIAKYTDFSIATVSMALAGHPNINEETRRTVHIASKKLGYNKTSHVAVPPKNTTPQTQERRFGYLLVGNRLDDESKAIFAHALASEAMKSKIRFELFAIEDIENSSKLCMQAIEYASDLDGIIVSFAKKSDPTLISKLSEMSFPFVLIGHLSAQDEQNLSNNCEVVAYSCLDMGQAAVEYLHKHGHTRIGFVSELVPPGMAHDRWLSGYQLAQVRKNLPLSNQWVHIAGKTFAGGGPAAEAMTQLPEAERPTAYIVPDVRTASSFINAMKEKKIKLDEKSIVMGGDRDVARSHRLDTFPLMSIDHDNMAALSFRRLNSLCTTPGPCSSVSLVPFVKFNMD